MPLTGGLAALDSRRVAVFGAGVEGRSFARLVAPRCAELLVVDDAPDLAPVELGPGLPALEVLPARVLGDARVDVVVRSPGVSRYDARFAALEAAGAVVTTATALWMEDFRDAKVVAITGSKGKTTTAMLTAAVLGAHGLDAVLAGNIGRPLTELYAEDRHDAYVVELSSFQTADLTVSPTVGVLTLLAPDHLDWHGGTERYFADKLRLFAADPLRPLAVNGCSEEAVARTVDHPARVLYGCAGPVRVEAGGVIVGDEGSLDLDGFQLLGDHNLVNACGAVVAAQLLTGSAGDPEAVAAALVSVPPARARLEPVAVKGQVTFVDDALASNPSGTVAALRAFAGRPVVLIAGGQDRGVDFAPLAHALATGSPPAHLVVVDEAGDALAAAVRAAGGAVVVEAPDSLEAAVARAAALAERAGPEAVVLFSPGAPTPRDQGSYLDRSQRLRAAVAALGAVPVVRGGP